MKTKHKRLDGKHKNFIIKTLFGVLIGAIVLAFLFTIWLSSFGGKIVGLIFYLTLVSVIIYEFMNIFPVPKWSKFYFPFIGILSFLLSLEIFFKWFNDEKISLNSLIILTYEYTVGFVPGVGYLIILIVCCLPFLFVNKSFKTIVKSLFLSFFVITIFTIVSKSLLFLNSSNIYFLLFLLTGPIICDVMGYLGGHLLGNKIFKEKKLAPKISPNKTIEGAITAFIACWISLFLILWYVDFADLHVNKYVLVGVLPIFIPILAILGDLFFSKVKRIFSVKDYANLIPQHGGILDRTDSIIITSFFVASIFMII